MKEIIINALQAYKVVIGSKVLHLLMENLDFSEDILVITDDNVKQLHLCKLERFLPKFHIFSLGSNPELNKNLQMYEECIEFATDNYLTRNCQVIAFGGGAVGDFASFFASTYKRGVKLYNLPTTLLAHDSAIGGKTALNVNNLKNVVGTFYQPQVVIYDVEFLMTLTKKEILSGFGEVIKHDMLGEGSIQKLLSEVQDLGTVLRQEELISEIIYSCIMVKKRYIEGDIYDRLGVRKYLNFGHTLGHALEKLYQLSHGEAVIYGILFALFISNAQYKAFYEKMHRLGYFQKSIDFDSSELVKIMLNDKKNFKGFINFIGYIDNGSFVDLKMTVEEVFLQLKRFNEMIREW